MIEKLRYFIADYGFVFCIVIISFFPDQQIYAQNLGSGFSDYSSIYPEKLKLSEIYNAKIVAEEKIENRDVWKMELTALVDDINYFKRILWVDKKRYVPIKEDLFAKSGELLKRISFRLLR